MSQKSTEQLVAEYRDAATRHGSIENPTAKNAAARQIANVYRELRARGDRSSLLPLLDDAVDSVRGWAAAHALEFAPEAGVPVLEALENGTDPALSLDAEMTLKEWRAGRLRFP